MTDIQITPKYYEIKPSGFYVYTHRRSSDGSVFYVGKGKIKRGWIISTRSSYWKNTAIKHGSTIRIEKDNLNEYEAFKYEIFLIRKIKENGGKLVNLTDGGEGTSGRASHKRKEVYSSLGERFDSITIARDFLRCNGYPTATESNITGCCKGRYSFIYGRCWSYTEFPEHPDIVDCKAINGKRVTETMSRTVYSSCGKVFPSCSDAQRWLIAKGFAKASIGSISRSSREGGVYLNRRWSYASNPDHDGSSGKENRIYLTSKGVATDTGMSFTSMKLAVDYLKNNGYPKADYHGISKCCAGKQITAYGLKWRLHDTNDTQRP